MAFEILHLTLMLLGRRPALESAEIASLPRFRICLARIKTIFSALELADHGILPLGRIDGAIRLVPSPRAGTTRTSVRGSVGPALGGLLSKCWLQVQHEGVSREWRIEEIGSALTSRISLTDLVFGVSLVARGDLSDT